MQETTSVFSFITLFWEKIGVTYILQKGGDGSGCFYLMVGKGLVFPLPNSQTKFLLNMPMSAMVTKDYQQEHCRNLPRLEISSLVCLPSFCTRKQDVKKISRANTDFSLQGSKHLSRTHGVIFCDGDVWAYKYGDFPCFQLKHGRA